MEKKIIIWAAIILAVLIITSGICWYIWQSEHPKYLKLSAFATCLKDSGAKFYGAFWCPHCQNEKALFKLTFENAEKDLPYIECSTPDSRGQLKVCKDQGIMGYPTWVFADGSRQEGEMSLQDLANKTSCPLP